MTHHIGNFRRKASMFSIFGGGKPPLIGKPDTAGIAIRQDCPRPIKKKRK